MSDTLAGIFAATLQTACVLVLAPVVVGVTRQVRARMEGRSGAGVWQPLRDLRKLFRKRPLTADGVILGRAVPVALVATSVLLVALLPLVTMVTIPAVPADLFVVVSVLLVGSVWPSFDRQDQRSSSTNPAPWHRQRPSSELDSDRPPRGCPRTPRGSCQLSSSGTPAPLRPSSPRRCSPPG